MDRKSIWKKKSTWFVISLVLFLVTSICYVVFNKDDPVGVVEETKEDEIPIIEEPHIEYEEVEAEDSPTVFAELIIRNKEEHIEPIMNPYGYLVHQYLYTYAIDNHIDAMEVSSLAVQPSLTDPAVTNLYIEFHDSKNTLVVITYHSKDKTLQVAKSPYTKEEITNEVWITDGMPLVRDVQE